MTQRTAAENAARGQVPAFCEVHWSWLCGRGAGQCNAAPPEAGGSVCWKCGQPIRDAYVLGLIDGSGRVEHPRGCPAADAQVER